VRHERSHQVSFSFQERKKKATVSGVNFTAYSVAVPDGSTSVLLVNNDPTQTVTTTVDLGFTRAEVPSTFSRRS
jgi:hypothetical protein